MLENTFVYHLLPYFQIAYYLIASVGICIAGFHYSISSKRRSFQDTLEISQFIRDGRREFEDNRDKDEHYYFIELICVYEVVCGIHNSGSIGYFTKEMIEAFLASELEEFSGEIELSKHLEVLRDKRGTLDEVRKFICRNPHLFNEFDKVRMTYFLTV